MWDTQRGRKAWPWQVGFLETPEKAPGAALTVEHPATGFKGLKTEPSDSDVYIHTGSPACLTRQSPWSCALGKEGTPANLRERVPTRDPPSGARTLYSCSATRCGLVRASPSPHWGCPQLQGAFQPQKSPHECLPFRKQPSSFLGTSKNLAGKQSVPGGDEGGACTGTPEHPI